MNRQSTTVSADDAVTLREALESLTNRVDAFERNLQHAIQSERTFRISLETVSDSLHSFVESHQREDELLTRLVKDDTQRSREAKVEYDALAASFEESLRPHAADRRRRLFKTISLYVGIVLSVVFMAPIHLLVSFFDKFLLRLGYRTPNGANGTYAHHTARHTPHHQSRHPANPRDRGIELRNRRRNALGSSAANRSNASLSTSLRSTLGSTSIHSSPLSVGAASDPQLKAMHLDVPGTSPQEDTMWLAESLAQQAAHDGAGGIQFDATHDMGRPENEDDTESLWDEADVFVDAVADAKTVDGSPAGSNTHGADTREEQRGVKDRKGRDSDAERKQSQKTADDLPEDEPRRPDWARPFDDGQSPREMADFPSADFWRISDEELRIDRIDREDDTHDRSP